jgi:uncharacterized protein (DUF697 family)
MPNMVQQTETTDGATALLADRELDKKAAELVDRYAAWSAAAGVIPVPLVDMLAVGGLQLQMLRRIAQIYEPVNAVHFSEERGKAVIASLVGTSTATITGVGVASVMKGIPGIGTILASLSMPALSAAATYAIGHVFIKHFASGGTLLDFEPENYRDFIRAQTDKLRTTSRTTPATTGDQPGTSKPAPAGL